MAFGFDPLLGYIPATGPALLADFKAKYVAESVGPVDTDNGPAADFLKALSVIMLASYQSDQGAYDSQHINAAPGSGGVAEGSSLELQLSPKIGPKLAAAKSSVVLPLFAAPGPDVPIPAGSKVTIDGETVPWTLAAGVLIPGGGSIDGTFEYGETGPKQAPAAIAWAIQTPVTGWASVGPNAADAVPGRNLETDAEYRARYYTSLDDEAYSAVARVPGVSSVFVREYQSSVPDGLGRTHYLEVIVSGGDDLAIAAAITGSRAKGVATVGTTEVDTANPNYTGGSVVERFSRPQAVQTFVSVVAVPGQGYPVDLSVEAVAARRQAVSDAIETRFGLLVAGKSISAQQLAIAIDDDSGIPGCDEWKVLTGIVSPPPNAGTLTPAELEVLTVSPVDIDTTGVP
jgi:hypothetical protein